VAGTQQRQAFFFFWQGPGVGSSHPIHSQRASITERDLYSSFSPLLGCVCVCVCVCVRVSDSMYFKQRSSWGTHFALRFHRG
jgi:hypothetical protein